jgi:L-fuconolactonase
MTRRHLLALLASTGWSACAARMPASRIPAIDTHTHFYQPVRPQGVPWPSPDDRLLYRSHLPDEFVPLAAAVGIVGTVAVEASPWVDDNQWLLDLADSHPVIVGVVGNLAPGETAFRSHLARFTRHPLFRGIRLGERRLREGLGAGAFGADMRRLADADLALDLLGGPAMLEDVVTLARRAPRLRIVIDHLPFAAWDGHMDAGRRALEPFRDHPRVYAKVSGVLRPTAPVARSPDAAYRPRLDLLWDVFGRDRVLFGSNWPVSNRIASYADTYRVVSDYVRGRGRDDAERFFWRNSRAVYAWKWRAEGAFPGRTGG